MLQSLEIRLKPHLDDSPGRGVARNAHAALGMDMDLARVVRTFTVEGLCAASLQKALDMAALHDPLLHEVSLTPFPSDADWIIEVAFRPGVTDTEGRVARDTLALVLGLPRDFAVYSAAQYHLKGAISRADVERIAKDMLANELIQRVAVKSGEEWLKQPGFALHSARVTASAACAGNPNAPGDVPVAVLPLSSLNDEELMALSRENTWALSLEEMRIIRDFYAEPATVAARAAMNLPSNPTDAEMEVLAQTWSEHCKHKIFAALIDYEDAESGNREHVDSLYRTYIQGSTAKLRKRMGDKDFCRSVFKDNAGVVAFNDTHDVCIKVETHNSPSALDPYGGAMTGVLGVNRDVLGTGIGGEFVCNMGVFCVASPAHEGALPPRLLHPRRILEGARRGMEEGSNKSGVPTVNGSLVFDERFLGKPLVYCGTVGILPREIHGKPGHYKRAHPGDVVVMVGGRIGKDGIHGATFSSEELHEGSPATTVQLGDSATQRKLYDCIIRARDIGLYSAITDNGAGGLSSSVGEMAENTGGCRMDLAKAPLKYAGLKPWEILVSEAQERMTLAVPKKHLDAFLALAAEMDVEATALGEFTESGYFHVTYGDTLVAYLPMHFMHDGVPQMRLAARWERPAGFTADDPARLDAAAQKAGRDHASLLLRMLGRLNICSKENMIRQYDHESGGGSVIKPLVGVRRDGPGDAAVLRPLLASEEGIVLSHGICPKFSDADTYWMMANAIDEAVRNAVAVGANPERLAGVDNFCWCDPVQSEKTPDGHYKLAQLVRAGKALEHFCLGFGVPCVSGKDSMKNDYTGGGAKISIPPTVLFSILGHISDVNRAVSSDFKQPGDVVYLLGRTGNELGGSEIASELGLGGGAVPQVDLLSAKARYSLVHKAMQAGLVNACHDLSDGGLAVALAEMALGGRLGAAISLDAVPVSDLELSAAALTVLLYSESASRLLLTVPKAQAAAFEALFTPASGCMLGLDAARIGEVTPTPALELSLGGSTVLSVESEKLAAAFKATLDW